MFYGAFNKRELQQIKKHLATVTVVPLDTAISRQFLLLMEQYSLSHKLSIPDALIAATALSRNVPPYTFNLKDFRFLPNLTLHNPSTPAT